MSMTKIEEIEKEYDKLTKFNYEEFKKVGMIWDAEEHRAKVLQWIEQKLEEVEREAFSKGVDAGAITAVIFSGIKLEKAIMELKSEYLEYLQKEDESKE